jgi:glyoxylate carboligase
VCDTIAGSLPAGTKVPQAALLHAFKEAGWIDCGRIGSVEYSTKKHIYAAPDVLATHSKSELRRMVEYVAPLDGGVVKT